MTYFGSDINGQGQVSLRRNVLRHIVVPKVRCVVRAPPKQNAQALGLGVFLWGPDDDLLSHGQSTLSSARRRFTVLFGMGRRGTNVLWSSGILWSRAAYRRSNEQRRRIGLEEVSLSSAYRSTVFVLELNPQCYRIKPHGQLVSVSLTSYNASTPDLSTRWSSATL